MKGLFAPTLLALAGMITLCLPPAVRAGDEALRGKILFLRCASCHDITGQTSGKIGPNLRGVVGREVASQPGYPYSEALKSQHFTWDAAHLDAWLTNPNAVAPGTAMAFAGIANDADRRALIAYLEAQHGATP